MWSSAFNGCGRCVVPADGYYEWLAPKDSRLSSPSKKHKKSPYYVRPRDGSLMYFAGLYSSTYINSADEALSSDDVAAEGLTFNEKKSKRLLYSYAIVTTTASRSMKFLHSRMPLILFPGTPEFDNWINPTFKNVDTLPTANDDDMIEDRIICSGAEIHLSGKLVGKPLTDTGEIGAIFARATAKRKASETTSIKSEDQSCPEIKREQQQLLSPPSTIERKSRQESNVKRDQIVLSTPVKKKRRTSTSTQSPELMGNKKITQFFQKEAVD